MMNNLRKNLIVPASEDNPRKDNGVVRMKVFDPSKGEANRIAIRTTNIHLEVRGTGNRVS